MSDFTVSSPIPKATNAEEEQIIKVKAWLDKTIYPKPPKVLGEDDNTWGVTHWAIHSVEIGEPILNKRGLLVVTGEFYEPIDETKVYTILAKQTETDYGVQYKLMYYQQDIDFSRLQNQKAFLRSFLTDGQIEEIYKVIENPLEVLINHDKKALMQVHGIGDYISDRILERFEDHKDMSVVYIELDQYGLTPEFLGKLTRRYKIPNKIVKIVKEDPYQLIDDIDGIGFIKADTIALKGDMSPKDVRRVKAWIKWFLKSQGEEGHSYITAGELLSNLYYQFGGKDQIEEIYYDKDDPEKMIGSNIGIAMQQLQDEGVIGLEDNPGVSKSRRRVYLTSYWVMERNIAFHLKRLLNAPNNFNYKGWEEKVAYLEKKQGFKFADEQLAGIKLGLEKQVCFISGLGGTGKSSLVSGILAALDNYPFAQCALSGKASARLQEVTGAEGKTIHRLLGYNSGGFMYGKNNKLPYDIIILDEISLVGGDIFLSLLEAIGDGCKLIMLGDMGQLEAIGALNLAADMHDSPIIPTVELTQVHRQAAMSGIITVAHKVRHQEQLFENYEEDVRVYGELQDMEMDVRLEKDEIKDIALEYFQKFFNHPLVKGDIMNIQLVSPVKERGSSCVLELNLGVQAIYNPVNEADDIPKIKIRINKDRYYYIQVGDKVLNIKNNYNTTNTDGIKRPIFNGWNGKVIDIDCDYVWVHFPLAGPGPIAIPRKDISSQLVLGYCSTVHKLQGSDFPVVIGCIDYSTPPQMLTSQLIYTLITRAKKYCVMVVQNGALRKAIATDFVSSKRTFLPEFLEEDNLEEVSIKDFKHDSDKEDGNKSNENDIKENRGFKNNNLISPDIAQAVQTGYELAQLGIVKGNTE